MGISHQGTDTTQYLPASPRCGLILTPPPLSFLARQDRVVAACCLHRGGPINYCVFPGGPDPYLDRPWRKPSAQVMVQMRTICSHHKCLDLGAGRGFSSQQPAGPPSPGSSVRWLPSNGTGLAAQGSTGCGHRARDTKGLVCSLWGCGALCKHLLWELLAACGLFLLGNSRLASVLLSRAINQSSEPRRP